MWHARSPGGSTRCTPRPPIWPPSSPPGSRRRYTCCNCATRFTRLPRLQRILRHVGVTCEVCTERHPVTVDGEPFSFLRRHHNGVGMYTQDQFEAWLYDTDGFADHRDRMRYVNTRASRAEAMADLAWRRSIGPVEDDPRPVLAVVVDEEFNKYAPEISDTRRTASSTARWRPTPSASCARTPLRTPGAGSSTPTPPPSPGA
jgi:hypothetical protein